MLTCLDTRTKIVASVEVVRDGRPLTLISGYFDPLHCAQIQRLRNHCGDGRQIVALVCELADSLLPLRARAELAASLSCVDYVVTDAGVAAAILQPDTFVDEREAHSSSARELAQHVVRRHRST